MEFLRNVLLIDKSNEEIISLKADLLNHNKKFSVYTLNSRNKIAEISNQAEIRYVLLNTNIGKNDVFFILKFIKLLEEKRNYSLSIFLISEDYDLLQEILSEFSFEKLQVLHTPFDKNDFISKLQLIAFGSSSNEKSKNKNDILDIDLEFLNVFISATKRILAEMAQLPPLTHSPPQLMSKLKEPIKIGISSKILISSVYFKGSYFIAFPEQTFFNFYEKVVMEKCTSITNENKDFVGELANIIYGQCKKQFSELGYNLDMVIPSTHIGDISYDIVILIPFNSELGLFYLAFAPGLI